MILSWIVCIYVAQMRNFVVEDDIDIEQLCKTQLPAALTGADVYDITSRAYAIALGRKLIEVDALLTGASSSETLDNNTGVSFSERCRLVSKTLSSIPRSRLHVALRQTDLLEASRSFKPSVSEEELLTYESIAMRLGETN